MSFQDRIPAQEKALYYTQTFAQAFSRKLILCGHSKGGNLAVYAASRCPAQVQDRILRIYNNDGPGFTASLMGDPGYLAMVPRIYSYVPQSSIVGMLMEHEEPYTVIRSRQVSILQHDLYSWEVMGSGFVPVPGTSADARLVNRTVKEWLTQKTPAERNAFVDAVFELLGTGEVDSAREIMMPWNILNYLRTLNEDDEMRRLIGRELADLVRLAVSLRRQKDTPALPG